MQWALLPYLRSYGGPLGEAAFIYIFALYMICDMLLVPISRLILLHHIFCLLGHALVVFWLSSGFATYFAGVVALEIGSGAMNAFLLRQNRCSSAIYLLTMSLSNCAVRVSRNRTAEPRTQH
jgi:hypothetical protein